ncbi:MAG: hypothetical protein RSC81_04980 [Myroides sp.]
MTFLFSLWCNAQIAEQKEIYEEHIIPPLQNKEGKYKSVFDYVIEEDNYVFLLLLIENNPQGVIDEIEAKERFSYKIFEKIPLTIKVDKALEALERNPLKGNIYKELKKSLKKHIKRQKKNPAS